MGACTFLKAGVVAALCVIFFPAAAFCDAFDLIPANPFKFESIQPSSHPNSIYVFGGAMSTSDVGEALLGNLLVDTKKYPYPSFDNSIVGAAYDRALFSLGYGLSLGGEIGLADRFGDYARCCTVIVKSNTTLQTGELWAGPQLRYAGVDVFNLIHVGGAFTVGLSAVTGSIGREQDRVIVQGGHSHLLYYMSPEIDFSLPSFPDLELVVAVHHRSGGKAVFYLPTLGNMTEGYNADVVGLRYHF